MKIKTFKNVIDRNFTLILASNSNEKNLINKLFECSTKININSKIIGKIGLIKNKIVLELFHKSKNNLSFANYLYPITLNIHA